MIERRSMLVNDLRMQAQTLADQGLRWVIDEDQVQALNLVPDARQSMSRNLVDDEGAI